MTPRGEERRSDNAPEPPPRPGEDSGGSPREKEEEEEECDEMFELECDETLELEDDPGVTTDTKAKVGGGRGKRAFPADRTDYKAKISDEARRLGEAIIAHIKNKDKSESSLKSYSIHIWRYLFFCEQKAKKEIYISLPMFVEFLEWYDIFSGHLQSNYKICGSLRNPSWSY